MKVEAGDGHFFIYNNLLRQKLEWWEKLCLNAKGSITCHVTFLLGVALVS